MEIFIEYINTELSPPKWSHWEFKTLRGAVRFLRSREAARVGMTITQRHAKGMDIINTYDSPIGPYYLTRRYKGRS